MKYLITSYFVASLVGMSFCLYGQDKIYYRESSVDSCKVTEITPAYIKGRYLTGQKAPYSGSPSDVMFIFNNKGGFLVVHGLYDNPEKAHRLVAGFLGQGATAPGTSDNIITVKNDIIACSVVAENDKRIDYTSDGGKGTIPKNDVALIIYKNGSHKLFSGPNKCLKVLDAIQDKYNNPPLQASVPPHASEAAGSKNAVLISTLPGSGENQFRESVRLASDKVQPSADSGARNETRSDMKLDAETVASLQSKAILNIKELETYLKIISDKDLSTDQVNNAIEQALSLFINEDAMVEVSSKNRSQIQPFKVRVYLNRLGFMKYTKVNIEWYNVQYASKVRLNPDGTYTGIIEFQQKFTGMFGDRKVYQDITRKTVEVFMKSYNKKKGGENIREWDVFLGNIGITVTEPE